MSGTVIPILSKRTYSFSNLVTGGSTSFPLVYGIDTSGYTEGSLLVRVHSGTTIGDTATVVMAVVVYAPTNEDPTKNGDFITATPVTGVTLSSSTTAPTLAKGDFTANFGGQVLIGLSANQDSNSQETITVVLSAELVLKN